MQSFAKSTNPFLEKKHTAQKEFEFFSKVGYIE